MKNLKNQLFIIVALSSLFLGGCGLNQLEDLNTSPIAAEDPEYRLRSIACDKYAPLDGGFGNIFFNINYNDDQLVSYVGDRDINYGDFTYGNAPYGAGSKRVNVSMQDVDLSYFYNRFGRLTNFHCAEAGTTVQYTYIYHVEGALLNIQESGRNGLVMYDVRTDAWGNITEILKRKPSNDASEGYVKKWMFTYDNNIPNPMYDTPVSYDAACKSVYASNDNHFSSSKLRLFEQLPAGFNPHAVTSIRISDLTDNGERNVEVFPISYETRRRDGNTLVSSMTIENITLKNFNNLPTNEDEVTLTFDWMPIENIW